jgi:hypothetical protein
MAATFSAVMRRYSAGEHAPRAISEVRRQIVSPDAAVSRAIVSVKERADTRHVRRVFACGCSSKHRAQNHIQGSSDNHGGGQHQHPGRRHV